MAERRIYAAYDDEGVYIYQAFTPSVVRAALEKGTFGAGFDMTRMTWIKPSFGWMLYRSGYATKPNQEAILKIKLSHAGFLILLGESVESSFNPRIYTDEAAWAEALKTSPVRHQWDPERDLALRKHATRRAIQIGIRGWIVREYVDNWIVGLEEVTALAHAVKAAVDSDISLPPVPEERVYPVDDMLASRLGITGHARS